MKIPPKAAFVFFRFCNDNGADVLLESGKSQDAKRHFASIVTRLHSLAVAEFWPGSKIEDPQFSPHEETEGQVCFQCPLEHVIDRTTALKVAIVKPKQTCLIYRNWGSLNTSYGLGWTIQN